METMTKCYIPVIDQENPNAVGLNAQQIEQVNLLNATSKYLSDQIQMNMNAGYSALMNAIDSRSVFIYERASILAKRMCDLHLTNSTNYVNNFACAISDSGIIFLIRKIRSFLDERIDTTAALDSAKIPNLLMLYCYELYQLNSLKKSVGMM